MKQKNGRYLARDLLRLQNLDTEDKNHFFVPLKRTRLSEHIYQQIKEAILDARFKQGERLPSEKVLCEQFKVGRAVIREALRLLESSGLVHIRQGSMGGTFVKNIDPWTLTNTFEGIVRLNNVSIEELTGVRVSIESSVFRVIIRKIQESDLQRLQKSIDEARHALDAGLESPRNAEFHIILAEITQNRLLIDIIESLLELESKFVRADGYSFKRKKRFNDEHQNILNLLREKKYDEALRAFEKHIEDSVCLFTKGVLKM